ncbi:DinB family protein [Streptomyces roseirectus]|uniref:DinB family protein n=1 Tax=Streptomyces roseirectus TaxID=2768066 RepID=A0A7H0IKY9_9ACTN|nr:DinB family protein [Streptomyces roseirectus]QNP73455.1 DinB family protein [Streptomyces roseirectus]
MTTDSPSPGAPSPGTPEAPFTLPDGRPLPPWTGDERGMLEGWLDFHRGTLATKCSGLDDKQVRQAAAEPSELTLLGLVQHLAEVERNWFQRAFAGLDVPHVYGEETGFPLSPDRGLDEALADWRREIARGRELTAGRSLDDLGHVPDGPLAGTPINLRWILVHLIEEYARHNGHADILREAIDGTKGF